MIAYIYEIQPKVNIKFDLIGTSRRLFELLNACHSNFLLKSSRYVRSQGFEALEMEALPTTRAGVASQ